MLEMQNWSASALNFSSSFGGSFFIT